MANLSLTAQCNRSCAYCFARGALDGRAAMTRALFERLLDLLERSGVGDARLLGGEPTLHPQFTCFLERALERGFRVRVFSNAMMPARALAALASVPADRVSVLVNAAAPSSPEEQAVQQRVLARLGLRASLGLNIHSPAFEPRFLIDWTERYGLSWSLRFGLAHPVAGGANQFLRPRHYRAVGKRLAEFAPEAAARGIAVGFDCGFVPCMFPAGSLAAMGKTEAEVGNCCGAIPDILPDGVAAPCYPLARIASRPFDYAPTLAELRARLDRDIEPLRAPGVFAQCAQCPTRRAGACRGGCVAHASAPGP
jgi:MoaA/NifB/PqqE/SkfB family radical SAM enzyme